MRADVFCRVIDNYGDIGVCWRLARRLARGRGWQVRLWVDDLASFARIEPSLDPSLAQQQILGITLVHWRDPAPDLEPGDVVVEAFACQPPASFIARMQPGKQAWINLEYLSAEPWVESCHALPSPQAKDLIKHFFFPGFTVATGGLLREPDLLTERDAWQADPTARQSLLSRLGVSAQALAALRSGARLCTLFCYPNAPLESLLRALQRPHSPTVLLVPHGVAPRLAVDRQGHVLVERIPFVTQTDFDRLLWSADLNLVRGEDSFVRALWAARPMLWHIYPQDEDTHLSKLNAWLTRYQAPSPIAALMRAWNGATPSETFETIFAKALTPAVWQHWNQHSAVYCDRLASQPDLADALADFCGSMLANSASLPNTLK